MLITVVELPEYIKHAEHFLDEKERNSIIDYLAAHPESGKIMRGTGGIRKIRWARKGRGKSGGVRVIYYFHNEFMPVFLLTMFGKNEKDNIEKSERNKLSLLIKRLVELY